MRRKQSRIILISFLSVLFSFTHLRATAQERPPKKKVTVCVLNDTTTQYSFGVKTVELPLIPRRRIEEIVQSSSNEYEANTGVTFEVVEYHETQIEVGPTLGLRVAKLRLACPQGEIVAAFTNQPMIVWPEPVSIPGFAGAISIPHQFDGWNNDEHGILWMFAVQFWNPSKKARSNPITTFEHEVGHLFGLNHSLTPTDFMYENGGNGAWSDRIRTEIKKNINMHWKMQP